MEHELAEGLDLGLSSLDEGTRGIVEASVRSLVNRPDYDGFVTVSEGIQWAKDHPNALNYPTPNNTLYINAALLDFGELSVDQIKSNIEPINLFTMHNTLWNQGDSFVRRSAIFLERMRTGLNDTHGFRAYYYGYGVLRK